MDRDGSGICAAFSIVSLVESDYVAAVAILLMGAVLVLRGFQVPFLEFVPIGRTGVMDPSCCPR